MAKRAKFVIAVLGVAACLLAVLFGWGMYSIQCQYAEWDAMFAAEKQLVQSLGGTYGQVKGRIIRVDFSNARLDDGGLRQVFDPSRHFDDLRELALDGTQVTDAGLTCLTHLKSLQHLSVENTAVTSDGAASLIQTTNIKIIAITPTTNSGQPQGSALRNQPGG